MLQWLKGPPAAEWNPSRIVLFDIFTSHTVTFPFFFKDFTVKKFKSNEKKKKYLILKRTFLGGETFKVRAVQIRLFFHSGSPPSGCSWYCKSD